MIEWWVDIPNLETVYLPDSFEEVITKSITSICMNMNEWIDVSPILEDLFKISINIHNSSELNELHILVTDLVISPNSYNEWTSLNLNEYRYLKSIEIGNDCFKRVDLFNIDGLNELKSIKIGSRSFSTIKSINNWNFNKVKNDCSRSFHVLNCIELESIEIGRFSFVAFGDKFRLFNLPKLSTIKIGEIGYDSHNFYFSSFVIIGIIECNDNE